AKLESNGAIGRVESAFDRETETVAIITGTIGEIRIPHFHRPAPYTLTLADSNESQLHEVPYDHDDFYSEIVHVVECIQEHKTESPSMSLRHSDTVAQTRHETTDE